MALIALYALIALFSTTGADRKGISTGQTTGALGIQRPLVKCRLRTCGPDVRTGKGLGLVLGFMLRVRVRVRVSVRVNIKVRVSSIQTLQLCSY